MAVLIECIISGACVKHLVKSNIHSATTESSQITPDVVEKYRIIIVVTLLARYKCAVYYNKQKNIYIKKKQ